MTDKKGANSPDDSIPSDPPPEYTATPTLEPGRSLPIRGPSREGASSPGVAGSAAPPPPGVLRKPPPPLDVPIITHLRSRRVILASASPRRKALLAQIGLTNVEVWPSTKPEDLPKTLFGPFEYVSATAQQKCLDVYQAVLAAQEAAVTAAASTAGADQGGARSSTSSKTSVPSDPELVIAADTVIVTRSGQILEKPRSAAAHVQMLRHLRDTTAHRVLTAVCVLSPRQDAAHPGYSIAAHTEETKVVFAQQSGGLTDGVIESYVRTREGADKAGGYALQGTGGLVLVDKIEGSVDNVIGLPVRRFLQLAEKVVFRQNDEEEADEQSEPE